MGSFGWLKTAGFYCALTKNTVHSLTDSSRFLQIPLSEQGSYIQLYPSSPSTTPMLQQWLDNTVGLTSAPVPACGYSPASEPFGVCLHNVYSTTAGSLTVCSHKEVVDYLTVATSN